MVRFVLIVSVLLSVMVAPDRLGSNVMTAPLAALVMAERSVPGPLSALLVTTCADAVAPPAKTSMSRAGIPNCKTTAMATPQRAFLVFMVSVFVARPHPDLLPQEKGRRASVFCFLADASDRKTTAMATPQRAFLVFMVSVFVARPHPDLLPQEKGRRASVFCFLADA